MMRTTRDYLLLYLKGIAMGSADVIPGVSGGTIAFISGIYEELLNSVRSFNPQALRLLAGRGIKGFLEHINAAFLAVLLSGIGTAVLSLSRLILYWMKTYPELLWAFFFRTDRGIRGIGEQKGQPMGCRGHRRRPDRSDIRILYHRGRTLGNHYGLMVCFSFRINRYMCHDTARHFRKFHAGADGKI